MKCFVTGASGFIGSNRVRELLERGHSVKALLRPRADTRGLAGLNFERVEGDLSNRKALNGGLAGCDRCFHAAASYHLWLKEYAAMYVTNVEGTRNVIEAASAAGCSRIVYTSTVGCIGLPRTVRNGGRGSADHRFAPPDENTPGSEAQMTNHYKLSKWQTELVVRHMKAKSTA